MPRPQKFGAGSRVAYVIESPERRYLREVAGAKRDGEHDGVCSTSLVEFPRAERHLLGDERSPATAVLNPDVDTDRLVERCGVGVVVRLVLEEGEQDARVLLVARDVEIVEVRA